MQMDKVNLKELRKMEFIENEFAAILNSAKLIIANDSSVLRFLKKVKFLTFYSHN